MAYVRCFFASDRALSLEQESHHELPMKPSQSAFVDTSAMLIMLITLHECLGGVAMFMLSPVQEALVS